MTAISNRALTRIEPMVGNRVDEYIDRVTSPVDIRINDRVTSPVDIRIHDLLFLDWLYAVVEAPVHEPVASVADQVNDLSFTLIHNLPR